MREFSHVNSELTFFLQFPADWAMSPLKVIHETPKKSHWSEFLESNLHDDESATRDEDYKPEVDADHVSDVIMNNYDRAFSA